MNATNTELDEYGGWTGIQGEKTGFFHLEEIDGRNWFVTPQGNVFFSVALSHLLSGESDVAFENRNYPAIEKTLNPRQLDDFEAILSYMCVTLYKIAHTAIRRWDNTHLIFGSFIKEWALTGESWKAAAPYIDMIAPQHFNREISVNELADTANLPILVSDDYFGFHYPGGRGHAGVSSHDARGEIYRANLMRHYKDPQVLGVTYCACMYDQGGATLAKNNQNGYYDLQGHPRENLIQAVTDINRAVYTHTPHPGTAEELRALEQTLFETWDKYQRGNW